MYLALSTELQGCLLVAVAGAEVAFSSSPSLLGHGPAVSAKPQAGRSSAAFAHQSLMCQGSAPTLAIDRCCSHGSSGNTSMICVEALALPEGGIPLLVLRLGIWGLAADTWHCVLAR